MHFFLAIHGCMVAGRAHGFGKRYCAHCQERLPSPATSLSPATGPSQPQQATLPHVVPQPFVADHKTPVAETTANAGGEAETDRLILTSNQ
jgi:hypothetical protein